MSMYTTGEIAKLCSITVRTVQYYDSRGILTPSELTEGGRRLYSEDDVKRMKIICFLRELGLSINSIGELMAEEHPEKVIALLLAQRESELEKELAEAQQNLEKIRHLSSGLKAVQNFSIDSIGDVANIMKNKKKLRKTRAVMLSLGIAMEIIEIFTAILWWQTGIWWPFALGMLIVLAGGAGLVAYYYKNIAYICPECHKVFKPKFAQMFFANHTYTTRKLTCTECGHKGFCVETAADDLSSKTEK